MPNEACLLGLMLLSSQVWQVIWKYSFEKHKEDAVHLVTAVYVNQFHGIDESHTFDPIC